MCAPTVLQRARSLGVEMPITQAVVDVIEGRLSAGEAVNELMAPRLATRVGSARRAHFQASTQIEPW